MGYRWHLLALAGVALPWVFLILLIARDMIV